MLNELCKEAHAISISKGWYDTERGFPELIALCHSELSEALEAYRDGGHVALIYNHAPNKPEGVPVELADTLIRIFDLCGFYGIDLDQAFRVKMEYNKTREYRHGNKRC